jgi:hypothetical protein
MIHNFDDSLSKGRLGEEKIIEMFSNTFSSYLCQPDILDCVFANYPRLQRQGVDLILSFPQIKVEIKTREAYWYCKKDILLETDSVVINHITKKQGWIYTTVADLILYLWWTDDQKQTFQDGYILFPKSIHPFLNEWIKQYPKKSAPNKGYDTLSIHVPIEIMIKTKTCSPIQKDYNVFLRKYFQQPIIQAYNYESFEEYLEKNKDLYNL